MKKRRIQTGEFPVKLSTCDYTEKNVKIQNFWERLYTAHQHQREIKVNFDEKSDVNSLFSALSQIVLKIDIDFLAKNAVIRLTFKKSWKIRKPQKKFLTKNQFCVEYIINLHWPLRILLTDLWFYTFFLK